MGSGRRIQDEREARRFLRAVERSGLSNKEWSEAHGIDGRSLHAWRMNLARWGSTRKERRRAAKSAKTAARKLVELIPTTAPKVPTIAALYTLEVGGARLEFGDEVSVATLRRVVEALRSC